MLVLLCLVYLQPVFNFYISRVWELSTIPGETESSWTSDLTTLCPAELSSLTDKIRKIIYSKSYSTINIFIIYKYNERIKYCKRPPSGSVPVFQLDVLSLVPSLYLDLVEHQEQFILGFHFGQTRASETFWFCRSQKIYCWLCRNIFDRCKIFLTDVRYFL